MTLSESTLLQGGKYKIIRVLGQGGFGITYLAQHTILNIQVCIKEFFPKDYVDRDENTAIVHSATSGNKDLVDRLLKRFVSEAKNIYQLNHPGIIRISDIFEENGTAYYVMDYVEGISLGDLIKESGALPEQKGIEYAVKIAEALDYIHAHNMTHFDLKPDNIMLRSSDNSPVIIDFGLSKQYNQSGHAVTSIIVGISKGYSPMEQYSEESMTTFSPRIDIYSLGATTYTLLSGRIPPEARLLIRDEIILPENISASATKAVQWAMKPFPEERCTSAKDFIRALTASGNSGNTHRTSSQFAPPPVPPINTEFPDLSSPDYPETPRPRRKKSQKEKRAKKRNIFRNIFLLFSGALLCIFLLFILIGLFAEEPATDGKSYDEEVFSTPSKTHYEKNIPSSCVEEDSDVAIVEEVEEVVSDTSVPAAE